MQWLTKETAKFIAKKHKLEGVIIIGFVEDKYKSVSYGKDKQLCTGLGKIMNYLCDCINKLKSI